MVINSVSNAVSKKKRIIYNTFMGLLAVSSVIFAVIDLFTGLSETQKSVDIVIYFIFVFDYIIRLIISKTKIGFIKNNILDLIAIIPFNSAFRVFRILKISKLVRMTKIFKLAKLGTLAVRGVKRAKNFLNTNGFKYMLLLVIILMAFGAIGISYAEKMSFSDSLWWSFVTVTTVGYGDISPSTNAGRLIATVLMLVGIGLIGSLTSTITSFFFKKANSFQAFEANSAKVNMALVVYNELTEAEKMEFLDAINK